MYIKLRLIAAVQRPSATRAPVHKLRLPTVVVSGEWLRKWWRCGWFRGWDVHQAALDCGALASSGYQASCARPAGHIIRVNSCTFVENKRAAAQVVEMRMVSGLGLGIKLRLIAAVQRPPATRAPVQGPC